MIPILSEQRLPLWDRLCSVYVFIVIYRGNQLISDYGSIAAGALRAGPDAHPPLNMVKALIFMGVSAMVICSLIFLLRGEQKRKMMDEEKLKESIVGLTTLPIYEDKV